MRSSKEMPKMKSNSSATKRFKRTASGKIKRGQSHRRHILTKKSTKRKRHLRSPEMIHESDAAMVRRMMPYG
jgi:large subunit ribosomal protein L35